MNRYTIPMWTPEGTKIGLDLLLTMINGYNLNWRITFFSGIGSPPPCFQENDDIRAFEEYIQQSKTGYTVVWKELREFARRISDLNDISLIGETNSTPHIVVYRIEGIDSTEWQIDTFINLDHIQKAIRLISSHTY